MPLMGETAETAAGQVAEVAERIARQAHQGQLDKTGGDYVEHPARVAGRLAARGWPDEVVAAGWLHDVLLDTDWSVSCLAAAGMPVETVALVVAVTRRPGQHLSDYYAGIVVAGPAAVAVKEADIDDKLDPARLIVLEPMVAQRMTDKYAKARRLLGAPHPFGVGTRVPAPRTESRVDASTARPSARAERSDAW